jgi:hypothetical protein
MTNSPDFNDVDLKSIRGLFRELEAQLEELRGHL